ncbi:MAG: PQQ-binding-like beta-propeller repeat protein [Planctomycetaceae bacterium]
MPRRPSLLALTALLVLTGISSANEWPQFRGTGNGVASIESLPVEWSEKEGIVWKANIPGVGHSSPVHDGKTIWMTTASPDGKHLGAVSVDAETGRVKREVTIFQPGTVEEIHHDNSYASPSPILWNGRVFVHFGTYGTACLDVESGKILWTNNDYHIKHDGGPGSSPVLFEGKLILTYDGADEQYVVALDAITGKEVWKRTRSAPFRENPITHRAFATPLLTHHETGWQLISPAADQCHAYNPANGEELWHVRYVGFSTVPCPVADANRAYLCTGFFKPEMISVALDGKGDVTESHVAWHAKGPIPDTPSPLLFEGKLYTVSNTGIAACHDAESGERVWVKRVGGNYSASPMAIGGRVLLCSEEGVTHIIDPADNPPKLKSNKIDGAIKATPAVLDSDLLLRTENALYRICGANRDK